MRIIPVLDLLNGVVVQAIAGRRSDYQPIRSCLTDSVDPVVVLRRLATVCQSKSAYVADLDAIMRRHPNRCTLAELSRLDLRLIVDAGVQSAADAQNLFDLGVSSVVLATESLPGPALAQQIVDRFGADRLIVSVDLRDGTLLAPHSAWTRSCPVDVVRECAAMGFHRWIILDLASVGTGDGLPTLSVCRQVRSLRPSDEIITGGGVRTAADLHQPAEIGVDGLLVASVLHGQQISASDIAALST